MKSTVKDKVRVTGRGCVIIFEPDEEIHITDKVVCNGNEFSIAGIERLSFLKNVGLILRPNDLAQEKINIGDDITVLQNEEKGES